MTGDRGKGAVQESSPSSAQSLLSFNYTTTQLWSTEALQGKAMFIEIETTNIKTKKDASRDQPFPWFCCPSVSPPSRKVPSHPWHNSLTPPSAQPLWWIREPLLHRAGAAAAPLRGAVPESSNNSHQCLKASHTHRSSARVNIQSLGNNCVE